MNQRATELIEAAAIWIAEGVSVVPAQPKSKAVLFHWRELDNELPTMSQVTTWFGNGVMNLAVVCGSGRPGRRLLVLDFDNLQDYKDWRIKAGNLAGTYTETSSRGVHAFFMVPNGQGRIFQQCEALGIGHLCNVAPSVHPSGAVYKSLGDPLSPIFEVEDKKLFSLLSEKPQPERLPAAKIPSLGKEKTSDIVSKIHNAYQLLDCFQRWFPSSKVWGSAGGRFYMALCPFHDDKNRSLKLDNLLGHYRCFSTISCSAFRGGDVINLYSLKTGLPLQEAIKHLAHEVKG